MKFINKSYVSKLNSYYYGNYYYMYYCFFAYNKIYRFIYKGLSEHMRIDKKEVAFSY